MSDFLTSDHFLFSDDALRVQIKWHFIVAACQKLLYSIFCLSPALVPVKALDDSRVRQGWWEGNTLVIQSKLEPLGQSGHILVPCHCRRSGCGLFPKKSCHTHSARVVCLVPAHALVSCPCHLVTFLFYSFPLPHCFSLPLKPVSLSLCIYLLFWSPLFSLLSSYHYCCSQLSVSVANLHLFQLWASITNSISLSVHL